MAPPVHVGHLRASVPCPERTGLKEQLIWGLWLTQAREREGYGMRGKPAAAADSMTLHQPEARRVFPLDCRTLAVVGCTGSQEGRGGVDSDLCLHTGFLVAAAAALVSDAHLWCPHW